MQHTPHDLQATATLLSRTGLHTGPQFAHPDGSLDICAAAYVAVRGHIPDVFYDDETTSIRLIQANPRTMAAIRAISAVLDTQPCETKNAAGLYEPDHIEHVSHWAATPPLGATRPPTLSEVIGRILRAANHAAVHTPAA
ncbi:DUF6197 family protein [Streptomyces griseosporeus]